MTTMNASGLRTVSEMMDTGSLLRIFLKDEYAQFHYLFFNAFILPVTVAYFAVCVSTNMEERLRVVAGGITTGLGMSAILQVGFSVLQDRFRGRLIVLRTLPVRMSSYYIAHILIGVFASIWLIAVALTLSVVLNLRSHVDARAVFWAILVAVTLGVSMGSCGAVLSLVAPSFESGSAFLSVAAVSLASVSPVFYSARRLPRILFYLVQPSPYTHAAPLIRAIMNGSRIGLSEPLTMIGFSAIFTLCSWWLVRGLSGRPDS